MKKAIICLIFALIAFSCAAHAETVVYRATVTTGTSAYATGDLIGGVITLTDVFGPAGSHGKVVSVNVLDKSDQSANLAIMFFSAVPTLASADNATLDISDSEMATKFLGNVFIDAYVSLSASAVSTNSGTQINSPLLVQSSTNDLYVVVQSRGSPTYAGTSDLVLMIGIERE